MMPPGAECCCLPIMLCGTECYFTEWLFGAQNAQATEVRWVCFDICYVAERFVLNNTFSPNVFGMFLNRFWGMFFPVWWVWQDVAWSNEWCIKWAVAMLSVFHNPTPPRFFNWFSSATFPFNWTSQSVKTYWTQLHFSMDIAIEGLHMFYVIN